MNPDCRTCLRPLTQCVCGEHAARPTDFLAEAAELYNGPQFKDGVDYLPDAIQLGIGQQLRRIADALEAIEARS